MPPIVVRLILLPVSAGLFIYAWIFQPENTILWIASCLLAVYTLMIWCVRLPGLIQQCRQLWNENPYARIWRTDTHLRMKVTLTGSVLWNGSYAFLRLCLGIYYRSAWFYSVAAYYFTLAALRFGLAHYAMHHVPGEDKIRELHHYQTCGRVLLVLNGAFCAMILHMVRENRLVRHHEITTIVMAAYAVTALVLAFYNVLKYRKYDSPVYSASKAISLACACVSLLMLEGSVLSSLQTDSLSSRMKIVFFALSGAGISAFIIIFSIYMVVKANQQLKQERRLCELS